MNGLDAVPETQVVVVGLLVSLADIDARLTTAYTRIKAAKLGSITLPGTQEIESLRSEGRRFSGRLAATLGVAIRQDVWSGTAPSDFASIEGMTGGGNIMRQG